MSSKDTYYVLIYLRHNLQVKYMLNKARVEKLKKQREAAKEKEKEAENKTATNKTADDAKVEGETQTEAPAQDKVENVVDGETSAKENKNDSTKDQPNPSKPTQDDHTEL
jgi:IS5 family transposase